MDGLAVLIALPGPACDLVVRRRIHPACAWGVGTIIAGQALVDVPAPSPLATPALRMLGTS